MKTARAQQRQRRKMASSLWAEQREGAKGTTKAAAVAAYGYQLLERTAPLIM
jgi:hypothetical protein